jgi:carboxymethylenebutenolidase
MVRPGPGPVLQSLLQSLDRSLDLALTHERVTLDVSDGTAMNAYIARPSNVSRPPGILVFQEAYGVNAYIRSVADRFADLGCIAIAPELFHRSGPGFEGSYDDFAAIRPHFEKMTTEGITVDAQAAYDWLAERSGADASRLACIGFCMGGRVSYIANANVKLAAAISFYGGGIAPDLLPLAEKQQAAILMFWGGMDSHIPPEQYRAVADALTAAKIEHEQVVFSRAGHGFFCGARASYDEVSSRQAFELVKAFLGAYGVL